jgi:hypothetical protein
MMNGRQTSRSLPTLSVNHGDIEQYVRVVWCEFQRVLQIGKRPIGLILLLETSPA